MLKLKILVLLGLLLLLLSACGQPGAAPSAAAPEAPEASSAAVTVSPELSTAPAPAAQVSSEGSADYCTSCHTDPQMLQDTMTPEDRARLARDANLPVGDVPVMEPWQKVLVDGENFPQSIHGLKGCISCHGGAQSPDKDTAHTGLVPNPSKEPQAVCGQCHPDVVANAQNSLHATVKGFQTMLYARSMPAAHPALDQAMNDLCANCHTTCGDCHVSQPAVVGGGFVNGHVFHRKPSMLQNCAVCHGPRVGNEYLGRNQGQPADVHYAQGNMECVDCHTDQEIHGQPAECINCHKGPEASQVPPPDHSYAGIQTPRCESCHPKVSAGQDDVLMHQMHGANLSCQVCHSVAYTSCEGCHVGKDAQTGEPTFTLDSSSLGFLIGRNPIQTYERPYRYVPVRHSPVTPDTFDYYGKDLLANFNRVETWTYTTPHNIQLKTPQNASCSACHGNPSLFLTSDKVSPDEQQANQDVIVDQPPPPISSGDQIPVQIP